MLFVLYRAGQELQCNYKVLSGAGASVILVYTLNEGLRFGRGIDYNLYGQGYEELEATGMSNWDWCFQLIARTLISIGIPWQGYVMLMSFIFIIATLNLLKAYKEIVSLALPIFVFFSLPYIENMVRWYMGFSFVMIAISCALTENKCGIKYWGFCVIALTFHIALLPFPFVFYTFLRHLKSPILSPGWVILFYFFIAFFFQTDYMMQFADLAKLLTLSMGDIGGDSLERFSQYSDRADYWLTGGFADTNPRSPFPGMQELAFLCILVILGHKATCQEGKIGIFTYNMFIIGFLLNPIARQIELISRYDQPFFFFRAIVLAYVIQKIFINRSILINQLFWMISLFIILNMGRKMMMGPFEDNPKKYQYVWDRGNQTYQSMYDVWIYDMYNADARKKRQE